MIQLKRLFESDEYDEIFTEELLDKLVDAVGSEEEVEKAAELCFNELSDAYEANELEIDEDDVPEHLAMSALIIKLVELGKLDPTAADEFLEDHLD